MGRKHQATVTHLEMSSAPAFNLPRPSGSLSLMRVTRPPLHFYRYLYTIVGGDYVWVDRHKLSDDALRAIIHDPDVAIYVLYRDGAPVGFAELDFRSMPTAELVYFGLIAETIGQGLGRYFLTEIIRTAWSHGPGRLIVQTCTLDHPRALSLYQRCGFSPVGQEQVEFEEP
ncbi:MAG: GNAT family N-acetyltransferase [Parvibaculaceae bacterium]|nr:GNAT family N-acetyltransferase [Parvibaculaceae bacterium]